MCVQLCVAVMDFPLSGSSSGLRLWSQTEMGSHSIPEIYHGLILSRLLNHSWVWILFPHLCLLTRVLEVLNEVMWSGSRTGQMLEQKVYSCSYEKGVFLRAYGLLIHCYLPCRMCWWWFPFPGWEKQIYQNFQVCASVPLGPMLC